jgi:mannose-6-phosphate isomerase-like protein (cupin superfamily)
MSGYTIKQIADVPDMLGDYPGEMRLTTSYIDATQVAVTFRRMPQYTGGKGSHGHFHKTQEELYLVVSGNLQFKLDDEIVEVGPRSIVRVAREVVRSIWNDRPEDGELLILSTRIDDPDDAVLVEDFWPL